MRELVRPFVFGIRRIIEGDHIPDMRGRILLETSDHFLLAILLNLKLEGIRPIPARNRSHRHSAVFRDNL